MAGLAERRGGVVALVGEAGAGKSRLLAAATDGGRGGWCCRAGGARRQPGAVPAAGRGVPRRVPGPTGPDGPVARGVRGAARPPRAGLAAPAPPADDSPVLLGGGGGAPARRARRGRPCVLVLEDLHWADPETLAVVEYLGDALRDRAGAVPVHEPAGRAPPPTCSTGSSGATRRVVRRRAARRRGRRAHGRAPASTTHDPPAGLGEFVAAHSDGNPFLVEELLAGLVAAGALAARRRPLGDRRAADAAVPASLRDSIQRRLAALDPPARRVLGAASLLGPPLRVGAAARHRRGRRPRRGRGAARRGRRAADRGRRRRVPLPPRADPRGGPRRPAPARAPGARGRAPGRPSSAANPGLPGPACQLAADLAEAAGDRRRRGRAPGRVRPPRPRRRRAGHRRGHRPPGAPAGRRRRRCGASTPTRCSSTSGRRRASRPTRSPSGATLAARLAAAGAPAPAAGGPARRAGPGRRRGRRPRAPPGAAVDEARSAAGDRRRTRRCWPGSTRSRPRSRSTAPSSSEAERAGRRAIDGRRRPPTSPRCCARRCSCSAGRPTAGHGRRPCRVPRGGRGRRAAAGLARWHLRARQELALDDARRSGRSRRLRRPATWPPATARTSRSR